MHLLVALALAGSPRALERCEGGRVYACGPAATWLQREDPEAAFLLAEWACEAGDAPACAVWAEMLPPEQRYLAWKEGCALGDAEACGIAVETGPDGRMDWIAAIPGCELGEPRSCARLEALGWRSDLVTAVREVPPPRGVGSSIAFVGGALVRSGPDEAGSTVVDALDVVSGTARVVASAVRVPSAMGVLFGPDGIRMVAALGDDLVVWPPDGGPPVRMVGGADARASTADPASGIFAALASTGPGSDGVLRRWRLDTGELLPDVNFPGVPARFVGSAGRMAAGTPDGIAVVDLRTGAVERTGIPGYPLAIGPAGELVVRPASSGVSVSVDGRVTRWVPTATHASLQADGGRVAIADPTGVEIFDVRTGDPLGPRIQLARPGPTALSAAGLLVGNQWFETGGPPPRERISGPRVTVEDVEAAYQRADVTGRLVREGRPVVGARVAVTATLATGAAPSTHVVRRQVLTKDFHPPSPTRQLPWDGLSDVTFQATTDVSGRFEFADLPVTGWWIAAAGAEEVLSPRIMEPASLPDLGELELQPAEPIRVTVREADGALVTDARVTCSYTRPRMDVVATLDGDAWRCPGLPISAIRAERGDERGHRGAAPIVSGAALVVLEPAGRSAARSSGLRVSLAGGAAVVEPVDVALPTDTLHGVAGSTSWSRLLPGTWRVRACADGGCSSEPITLAAGEILDCSPRLGGPVGTLEGRVVDAHGYGLPGVSVYSRCLGGPAPPYRREEEHERARCRTTSGLDGVFRLDGLEPGSHQVALFVDRASVLRGSATFQLDVAPGEQAVGPRRMELTTVRPVP